MQGSRDGSVIQVPLLSPSGWQVSQLRTSCGKVMSQLRPVTGSPLE